MARKSLEHSLAPLRSVFPQFRRFKKAENHLHRVAALLKEAAQKLRKARNQPFYSMREVAAFFAIPLRTVALAYRKLEDGGLLIRIRGSHTQLLGRGVYSRHPARSIVSVPIPSESFISSPFTRDMCRLLSQELWRHHFVAHLIFSQPSQYATPAFARRLADESDTVIWLFPDRPLSQTILTLQDRGVSTVMLGSVEDIFLPFSYLMDWTTVYKRVLRTWISEGIQEVVVAKPRDRKILASFLDLLRHLSLSAIVEEANARAICSRVDEVRKRKRKVGCAILEHESARRLCNGSVEEMAKLMTRCRVLLGRGKVYAPYFFGRNCRCDIVGFDGGEVAVQVAKDLGRRSNSRDAVRLVPQWYQMINLGSISA